MTTSYSPAPQPIHEAPSAGPAVDPNTLIALLHSIGSGVAANGQPWPERHQLRGRQMAQARLLADGPARGAGSAAGRRTHASERRAGAICRRPGDGRADHGRRGACSPRNRTAAAG